MVEMHEVSSSNVGEIGYDDSSETLIVKFLSGTTYEYRGVPRAMFDEMLNSNSVGGFLNANIKGIFPYDKV